MLLDFKRVHVLPANTAIVKNTVYVTREVDTGRAIVHFSTKDAGDPSLFRTMSMDDVLQAIANYDFSAQKDSVKVYATRDAYDESELTSDVMVYLLRDSLNDNLPSANVYLAAEDELVPITGSSTPLVWKSTEW
jgi:hypothetical protein